MSKVKRAYTPLTFNITLLIDKHIQVTSSSCVCSFSIFSYACESTSCVFFSFFRLAFLIFNFLVNKNVIFSCQDFYSVVH
jgi:hypothetical protein